MADKKPIVVKQTKQPEPRIIGGSDADFWGDIDSDRDDAWHAYVKANSTFLQELDALTVEKGGPGSGNWAHLGRKGKVGGSLPTKAEGVGAIMSLKMGPSALSRQYLRQHGFDGEYAKDLTDAGYLSPEAWWIDKRWGDPDYTQDPWGKYAVPEKDVWHKDAIDKYQRGIYTEDQFLLEVGVDPIDFQIVMERKGKLETYAAEPLSSVDLMYPGAQAGVPPGYLSPSTRQLPWEEAHSSAWYVSGAGVHHDPEAKQRLNQAKLLDEHGLMIEDRATHDFINSGIPPHSAGAKEWHRNPSSEQRGDLKNQVVTELAERTGTNYDTADNYIRTWALSSNDMEPRSLSLQEAATEVFPGATLSEFQQSGISVLSFSKRETVGFGSPYKREIERSMLTESYKMTQARFAEMGYKPTDRVRLFRGFKEESDQTYKVGETIRYRGNAIESWSAGSKIAARFGDYKGKYAIAMDVPISQIVSSTITGWGCLGEGEFIVLGNAAEHQGTIYHVGTD